jgi:hypothetical protein
MQIPSCPQKGFYRFCYYNASLKALVEEERAQNIWGNDHREVKLQEVFQPAALHNLPTFLGCLLTYYYLRKYSCKVLFVVPEPKPADTYPNYVWSREIKWTSLALTFLSFIRYDVLCLYYWCIETMLYP